MAPDEQMAQLPSTTIYVVKTQKEDNPASVSFCTYKCLQRADAMYAAGVVDNAQKKTVNPDRRTCIYCVHCGDPVFIPEGVCYLHTTCPDNNWSVRNFQVMGFMKSWRSQHMENPSDAVLDLAHFLGSVNPSMNFVDLYEYVEEELEELDDM